MAIGTLRKRKWLSAGAAWVITSLLAATALADSIDVSGVWCGSLICTEGVPVHRTNERICVFVSQEGTDLSMTVEQYEAAFFLRGRVAASGDSLRRGMISAIGACPLSISPVEFRTLVGEVKPNPDNGGGVWNGLLTYDGVISQEQSFCEFRLNRVGPLEEPVFGCF